MRFARPSGMKPLIWLPCRSRARRSRRMSMPAGMLPPRWLCERSRRVRVAKAEKSSGPSAPLSRIPRREMPLITGRRSCPVHVMPRQLQGVDMFSQDCSVCWLWSSRLVFQTRSALACRASTVVSGTSATAVAVAVAIITIVASTLASILGGSVSMAS